MLLMAGDASPTPGFLMLVQYVATLCHLHSIAIVQLQFKLHNQQTLDISQARVLAYGHKSLVVQLGEEDAVYKVLSSHALLYLVRTCSQGIHTALSKDLCYCCGITQLFSRWGCKLQIAHHKLVENELMIHHIVDATVPYVLKSDLDVFGSVEGAGLGWSFLKLQHIGSSFQAVPLTMLPHYWSCAQQVQ